MWEVPQLNFKKSLKGDLKFVARRAVFRKSASLSQKIKLHWKLFKLLSFCDPTKPKIFPPFGLSDLTGDSALVTRPYLIHQEFFFIDDHR